MAIYFNASKITIKISAKRQTGLSLKDKFTLSKTNYKYNITNYKHNLKNATSRRKNHNSIFFIQSEF